MTRLIYSGYDYMQDEDVYGQYYYDLEEGKECLFYLLEPEKKVNRETYIYNVNKLLKEKGKKMMYYGDMTVKFSEYTRAKELMPDAIAMNWCYYHTQPDGLARFDYSSKFLNGGIVSLS